MASSKSAERYAKSLYQIAASQGTQEKVLEDMHTYRNALKSSRDLQVLMESPIIPSSRKKSIADALFRKHFQAITGQFFDLVLRKGREKELGAIADAYIREDKKVKGIRDGKLISASPLTDDMRKTLHQRAEKLAGCAVSLEEKVDASLIGGFILTIGDMQLDESIKSKLNKLHNTLVDHSYTPKIDLI
jgi:F-type H+-transporting ATPase subunit delta